MEIMELCILKKPLPKWRNLPWLTRELTKGIRKRNFLYWRARRGGNSLLFDRYKEQRNKVVNELRRSKSHFFRSFNPSNPKQFWKIAKLLNKNSSLVKNGYTATTDADKATMLKGFFSMFQHCSTTIVDKPGGTFELLRTIQFWIYWWPIMHWKWNLWDDCIPRYLQS